jgi:hypothetical protein
MDKTRSISEKRRRSNCEPTQSPSRPLVSGHTDLCSAIVPRRPAEISPMIQKDSKSPVHLGLRLETSVRSTEGTFETNRFSGNKAASRTPECIAFESPPVAGCRGWAAGGVK